MTWRFMSALMRPEAMKTYSSNQWTSTYYDNWQSEQDKLHACRLVSRASPSFYAGGAGPRDYMQAVMYRLGL